ncbi:hypothetical protein KR074_000047 [Drosophila pseudoananassae]|nr:hypothetical protein KR074_000047 [Drosophila pseudoananassae]
MGKDPSAVVLATALAFCAFCPFFARCNDSELNHLENGIDSLSKIVVKYQAEFDNKLKFVQLQKAINEIDKAMLGYMGGAKDKLPLIRSLNSEARLTYGNCVGPFLEWCHSINSTFDLFIGFIGNRNMSETDNNIIWNMTVFTLESGLAKSAKSLELLSNVQNRTAELEIAFRHMLHDVHEDFGPGGFYGKEKAELQERIKFNPVLRRVGTTFVGALFSAIGALVFGPIGATLGLLPALATFGVTEWDHREQKKTYKERIEVIDHFFTVLTQKIENATVILKNVEIALEEDKSNLHKLRGVFANNNKHLLLSDMALKQGQLIPVIKYLKDRCANFVNWNGFDAPSYGKNSSRTRRAASTLRESHTILGIGAHH